MQLIELNEEQIDEIETRLSHYDFDHINYKMEGCIQIGFEEDGALIAGLDACITAYKILYVSTVFVNENYRRKALAHS